MIVSLLYVLVLEWLSDTVLIILQAEQFIDLANHSISRTQRVVKRAIKVGDLWLDSVLFIYILFPRNERA